MSKIKVAEIFYTLQGEGKYVGVPTVFLRTFGCNFQCRGFGMEWSVDAASQLLTHEPEDIAKQLEKHPEWRYQDLPLAKTGCDSYASWHPSFKQLSPTFDVPRVMDEIEIARRSGCNNFMNEGDVHLVITGGEPLLGWQRAYPELLEAAKANGYTHITFETNGTQKIIDPLADYLLRQQIADPNPLKIVFSVSPKLACSGEAREDALKPEVVASYQQFGEVYVKYVVAQPGDVNELEQFNSEYRAAGWQGDTYLMPMGGTPGEYNTNAPKVASYAMAFGYKYSPRLQVDIWKNEWGT